MFHTSQDSNISFSNFRPIYFCGYKAFFALQNNPQTLGSCYKAGLGILDSLKREKPISAEFHYRKNSMYWDR